MHTVLWYLNNTQVQENGADTLKLFRETAVFLLVISV